MITAMADITDAGPRLKAMNDALESNILADYRIWKSQQEERVGTHSKRCHLWPRHERCMIHRLAAELEKSRQAIRRLADQDATLSVCDGNVTVTMDATLTDAERGAMESALDFCERTDKPLPTSDQIATLRGLLGKRPERDKAPAAGGNLPSGKDTPKTHANSEKFTERESVT